eukprot:GAHX01002790.1.p1 GENE.GAHX01002790.1~~GAHX01002790.1.p1  ORF type:complete len:836 (-),score=141.73 GAHX01002790.1:85-2592(-)
MGKKLNFKFVYKMIDDIIFNKSVFYFLGLDKKTLNNTFNKTYNNQDYDPKMEPGELYSPGSNVETSMDQLSLQTTFQTSLEYYDFFSVLEKENIHSKIIDYLRKIEANKTCISSFNFPSHDIINIKENRGSIKLELPIKFFPLHTDKKFYVIFNIYSDGVPDAGFIYDYVFGYFEASSPTYSAKKNKGALNSNRSMSTVQGQLCFKFDVDDMNDTYIRILKLVENNTKKKITVKLAALESFKVDIRNLEALSSLCFNKTNSDTMRMLINKDHEAACIDIWGHLPESFKLNILRRSLNHSQYNAVQSICNATNGYFSLIQGPPGTGKTKTILSLINSIHLALYQLFYTTKGVHKKPKIFVCAPSNSAVDELLERFIKTGGLVDATGNCYHAPICRIGRGDKIRKNIREKVYLEGQVEGFLDRFNNEDLDQHILSINYQITVLRKRAIYNPEDVMAKEELGGLQIALNRLNIIKLHFGESCQRVIKERGKILLQRSFLESSQIIFTTLNTCSHPVILKTFENSERSLIDFCIIDEACQSTEIETLCALRFKPKNVVLVGDPQQLPATVFTESPSIARLERSLFERLQTMGTNCDLLTVQYRMHPKIMKFPSAYFYNDKLTNGPNIQYIPVIQKTCKDNLEEGEIVEDTKVDIDPILTNEYNRIWYKNDHFKPLLFYDVKGKMFKDKGIINNRGQAFFCLELIEEFYKKYKEIVNYPTDTIITILTPYQSQKAMMYKMLENNSELKEFKERIQICTIDNFQGQECPIVILCTVRGEHNYKSIGFVKDVRRLNVALTRAKYSLWIVGDRNSLSVNNDWSKYLEHLDENGLIKTNTNDHN